MLEIEKLPSSLSPSALMMAEKQPNKYYLHRLINNTVEREIQGLAAAVGSAFDYYIKCRLINNKFPEKQSMLEDIRKGVETNIPEAYQWGKSSYNLYLMSAYDEDEYSDVELHLNYTLKYRDVNIPLYGKLDASVYHQLTTKMISIPFDWKMSGYTSLDTRSPYPYYYWSAENGVILKGRHKNYDPNVPFEYINEAWATQLCTYGWLMKLPPGIPFPVRLDMLCFDKGKKLTIAKYRGMITSDFQERVATRYLNLWNSLMDESFLNRLASKQDLNLVYIASQSETWF